MLLGQSGWTVRLAWVGHLACFSSLSHKGGDGSRAGGAVLLGWV